LVLNFFTSKLQLYYSSSRLTLLLTFLAVIGHNHLRTNIVSLPLRLKLADENALGLHNAGGSYIKCHWKIFQDFLNSSDAPLALDGQKYSIAALACLKILFGHYQAPVSRFAWFSQHSRALRIGTQNCSQRHHTDFSVGIDWMPNISSYWHLRTRLPNKKPHGMYVLYATRNTHFGLRLQREHQYYRSEHLLFLLQKSAYSDNILDFARHRVFRFGYLARQHPAYIKKAIFALAKYIQRVTGEVAEVRACESIWGRDRWFTAQ
jgi:hypothetical protein